MRGLRRIGLTATEIRGLRSDRAVLESLLRSGKLDREGTRNLVASLLDPPRGEPQSPPLHGDIVVRAGSYSVLPRFDSAGPPGGPYWLVESKGRHFKGTGWAITPRGRSTRLISDDDTPYMFFGGRNPTTGRVATGGLFTGKSLRVWRLFLFIDDSEGAGLHWLELPIDRSRGEATFLIFELLLDGVRIAAIDPEKWQVLGSLTQTVPSEWGFRPSNPAVRVFRGVGLAQNPDNPESGSWFEGAHWKGLRLYSFSGSGPWRRWRTGRTRRRPAFGARLKVRTPLGRSHHEDFVDIRLDR